MLFGLGISAVLIISAVIFIGYSVNVWAVIPGIIISSFCFSSLGVFLASPSTKNPSNIMMLSSMVRFPLIFISGIFVSLDKLPTGARILSYFSPITYMVDIMNFSLKGTGTINPFVDFAALIVFCFLFLLAAGRFHRRNLLKGL